MLTALVPSAAYPLKMPFLMLWILQHHFDFFAKEEYGRPSYEKPNLLWLDHDPANKENNRLRFLANMHFGQVEPDELDDNCLVWYQFFSFPFFFPKIVYSRYVHADFSSTASQLRCIHPSGHRHFEFKIWIWSRQWVCFASTFHNGTWSSSSHIKWHKKFSNTSMTMAVRMAMVALLRGRAGALRM